MPTSDSWSGSWEVVAAIIGAITALLIFGLGKIDWHRFRRGFRKNLFPLNHSAPDRFTVLVADLAGDPDCAQTNHLVEALGKMGGFHVRTAATVLKCEPVAGDLAREQARLREKAQAWLRDHNADVLVWGHHQGQTFQLGFVPREGDAKTEDGLTGYKIEPDFTVPDDFTESIRDLLQLTILTHIRPATEQSGTYLAGRLRPLVPRLEAYLEGATNLPPKQKAVAWHSLGLAHTMIGEQSGDNEALEKAIHSFGQALALTPREAQSNAWAATQGNLAVALQALGERENSATRLEEAAKVYQEILGVFTQEAAPLHWAMTQNNLGNALQALGERESGTERLEQAVEAHQEALTERTRQRVPLHWAATQNNLGNALRALGERESGTGRLEQAVEAYQEALTERTRQRAPLHWAATQNNLGNALQALGERESGAKRLEQAVEAYQEALTERTRQRAPLDWAATQNNLGAALRALGERESGTKRLEQAVEAYQEALKEYTRQRVPLDWAMSQNNLGNALRSFAKKAGDAAKARQALGHYTAALEVFSQAAPYYREVVEGNMRGVQALIEELEKGR